MAYVAALDPEWHDAGEPGEGECQTCREFRRSLDTAADREEYIEFYEASRRHAASAGCGGLT